MAIFSKGIPRLAVLLAAITAFCLVPPEILARGPNICLWRHLFHLVACPACGSTRALAAFFHGHLAQALAFNRNVLATAPLLLGLSALDTSRAFRKVLAARPSSLNSRLGFNRVSTPS
jgi:hypothetical protein